MPTPDSVSRPVTRDMREQDREAVIAMLAGSEPWTRLGYTGSEWEPYFSPLRPECEAFVAEQDMRVVGIAVVRRRFLLGDYLELFGVAAEARRAGIGRTLLAHVESVVFARAKNLFICVSDFNEAARRFYTRQGYREIGPLPDLIVAGSAEILLRKTSGPARGKGQ